MMTSYQIALFVHLLALLAATAASAIVHFAGGRRARAATLREAMEWHRLTGVTARVVPVAIIVLLATGGYMVGGTGRWSWSAGWVIAGIVGALTLFVAGAVMGVRSAAEARTNAERLRAARGELPNDAPPDRLVAVMSDANTGLALAVVLVMTLKPGLTGALLVLAIGAVAGAYRGLRHEYAPSSSGAATAAEIGD